MVAEEAAEVLAGTFQDVSVTIAMQAGEDDKLFGSVTNRDIAAELAGLPPGAGAANPTDTAHPTGVTAPT